MQVLGHITRVLYIPNLDRFNKLRGRVHGQFRVFELRTLDHNAESGAKSRTTALSPCAPISN